MPADELRIRKMRARMILKFPWYGNLSLNLALKSDRSCTTMYTDGSVLAWNPDFIDKLTDDQLIGCIAHETTHCAMLHMYRAESRDMKLWNVACDYAVNLILKDQGFDLPGDVLLDDTFQGMAAERIYAILRDEQDRAGDEGFPGKSHPEEVPDDQSSFGPPQPGDEPGSEDSDSNQPGQEPGDPGQGDRPAAGDPPAMSESDWQIAAEQAAMMARKAGNLPGALDDQIKRSRERPADWRAILREFITQTIPSDYSWIVPNRRFIGSGLYLPGSVRENTPRLGVAVDTSGSVSNTLLACFARELASIVQDVRPEAVDVVYVDTVIQKIESYDPDAVDIMPTAPGRGGTSFQPAIDHFSESDNSIACLIYLTDLEASSPTVPDYPVLWVAPESTSYPAPFGDLVKIPVTAY